MRYAKPYLDLDAQVDLLESRGLVVRDRRHARRLLGSVGYYRLSGYLHPFRVRQGEVLLDRYRPGLELEVVESLWRFDRGLRVLVLEAVETVEVGMRTQVATHAGRRSAYAHLEQSCLNPTACARRARGSGATDHQAWVRRYQRLVRESSSEDFVQHFDSRYDGRLPVWAAVEVLDFGALARLLGLMRGEDVNAVARDLGLVAGADVVAWVRTLNVVRNLAAHHRRLWNRRLTYTFPKVPATRLPSDLAHLVDVPRHRVYHVLAVLAHLSGRWDPGAGWPRRVGEHCQAFPTATGFSPEDQMGFPEGWQALSLWGLEEMTPAH